MSKCHIVANRMTAQMSFLLYEPVHEIFRDYHIFGTLFAAIIQSLHIVHVCDKLFSANWLSALHDDNQKSCILNGERLSCPARNVDHLTTSDVNKWRDVTQNVRHSSVLLTFLRQKR